MLYFMNMQDLNSKYLIFRASQKWQNLTDLKGLKFCTIHYFMSDLSFCTSLNIRYFELGFYMLLKYNIIYI
jgi:hypothetical protein